MKKRTLYITDLDGTLLKNDQTVSEFTAKTIRELTEKGMLFSYATARSYTSSTKVTQGIPKNLPVILLNGSFIVEPDTEKRLVSHFFKNEEYSEILDFLISQNMYPVVDALFDEKEKFSYVEGKENDGIKRFLQKRKNDPRKNTVSCSNQLYNGKIYHIVCIDDEEKLLSVYERFHMIFPCVLYREMYSGDMWLEMYAKGATKATAVLTLKNMLQCEEVICFGDGKNDISMFQCADACYAVSNAEEELKEIATGIIESNEKDGVAKWLLENVKTDN